VEEYAYNTSTSTTTSDTTSFGYGVQGAQIQNITTSVTRRVRFTTPILSTDNIIVETSADQVKWLSLGGAGTVVNGIWVQTLRNENATRYGFGRLNIINSTDVDVEFGTYAANLGASFGAAGTLWSAGAGAGFWRVRKVQSGAAVGYPVSARNIVGDTSGTAVPAGYVGQVISGASDGTTTVAGSNTDKVVTTLSLSPGNWLIVGSVYFDPSGTTTIRLQSSISTGTSSGAGTILNILGLDYVEGAFGLSSGYAVSNYNFPANISSQTTFNVNVRITYTGTPSVGSPLRACIRAIRIA
jgi:hypothetical protein